MKRGILFIGHGSRFNHNKEAVEQQANALKERTGLPVWTAYNETTMPLADTVLEEMVKEGIEEIIAIPFFIASGLHITRDIPQKLNIPENSKGGKTTVAGKEVTVHFEGPIGGIRTLRTSSKTESRNPATERKPRLWLSATDPVCPTTQK